MPELPEVEEVRRTLEPHVIGVRVAAVRVLRDDFVVDPKRVLPTLVGKAAAQTLRHGKKLFVEVGAGGPAVLIHLGMSGRVDCVPAAAPVEKHTHLILSLASGTDVRCRDPRRFGGVWAYPTLRAALAAEVDGRLGPDALALTVDHLSGWKTARGRLKHRLLGQHDVAGLGNIYVDEALWMCGLHPLQRVSRIKAEKLAELVAAVRTVLHKSIRSGGTTLRDYRNVADQPGAFARELQAYGRAGLPCLRCGAVMRQAQVAGRTTVFCPTCQRCR